MNYEGGHIPAFAGIVQGVVVQIARDNLGNSSSNPSLVGVVSNLKIAYMLFETWTSGYCKKLPRKIRHSIYVSYF